MAEMYDRNRKQSNQSARARGNAEINIQQGRIYSPQYYDREIYIKNTVLKKL